MAKFGDETGDILMFFRVVVSALMHSPEYNLHTLLEFAKYELATAAPMTAA